MSTDERTLALVAAGGLDIDDRRILNRLAELVERADPVPAGPHRRASAWR